MAASTSWYPAVGLRDDNGVDSPELEEPPLGRMQTVSASQRFCRLCLSKEQQLKPIFPPDGTPDESLLQRILSCLTITISFDDDYDTFICRICTQEVTKFFLYKEQCLANDSIIRNRRKPSKGMFYDEEGSNSLGGVIVQNGNNGDALGGDVVELLDDSDVEEGPNWEEEEGQGDPIDSDEFDIREEGDDANDAEEFKDSDSEKGEVGSLLKPLPRMRARRENVQDFYHGGFRYTCATSRANGKIHWRCMYKSKLKCRAAILVAPNGTVSRGPNRHNHKPEAKSAEKTTEGHILDTHTGRKVHYRLITSERSGVHPVQVVCNGYKYRYARTTQKKTTYWRCMKHNGKENCKAVVSFKLDFSSCSSNGNSHNHPAQYDMQQVQDEEVEEPEVLPTFGILKPGKRIAHAIKSNGGSSSSGDGFGKTQISLKGSGRWNVMIHKGYEFGFPRADKKNNKWACYKKSLFNCPANVTTNETGRVIKESDWAHNHRPKDDFDKTEIIEGQMQDVRNVGQPVYYKLIPGKRGQRFVLYKGYRYSSDRLLSDGRIAWKCTKCKIFVMIGGKFATFEERGDEHEHPVQEEDDESMPYDASLVDALMAMDGGGGVEMDEDGSQDLVVKEEHSLVDEESQEVDGDNNGDDDDDDDDDGDELIIPEVMVE
uniref:ZAD domain-containing protein n=1 Tax=Culex tarsalis TaxID=7177 RepID=A0A1Q3EZ14_CULTA